MITEHPGLARQTWHRLRSASGVTELDEAQDRVDALAEAVGENHALTGLLTELVAGLEASVLPALERRHRPAGAPGTGAGGADAGVNWGIAEDPTDE